MTLCNSLKMWWWCYDTNVSENGFDIFRELEFRNGMTPEPDHICTHVSACE